MLAISQTRELGVIRLTNIEINNINQGLTLTQRQQQPKKTTAIFI